jgi:two-component system chemotaxis sensor kinase CheA
VNEFIEQFLVECRELVEQATDDLLALEHRPDDRERLDSAFRAFHTLKGAAGIVDFAAMETAIHAVEDVLSVVRSGGEPLTPILVGDCLTCLDKVVQWLDVMQATGEPPTDAGPAAQVIVARFASRTPSEIVAAPEITNPGPAPEVVASGLGPVAQQVLAAQLALLADPTSGATPGRTVSAGRVAVNLLVNAGRLEEAARLRERLERPEDAGDPGVTQRTLQALYDGVADAPTRTSTPEAPEATARGLRVDVERIDTLVKLTGELTVAKNALAHAAALAREGADAALASVLKDQYAVLDRLVAELQRAVLSIRVLPLRHVFQRFPRLVREMVVTLGKPARLVTEGDSTEADKTIVEGLFEPLLHVLRNALDHGIESAADRTQAGKPASATIHLRAVRHGDRVVIEVEDDGAGVDLDRVRAVALQRGLLGAAALAELSDQAILELILAPGFSTAEAVTSLSGRGVGMDAVKNAVARLGGDVTLSSRPGHGTTVRFVLPFTLMMSRVMTVEAAGQLYGIPMDAVLETVHVPRDALTAVGAARAFVLRDRTIPLIVLSDVLADEGQVEAEEEARVVVVTAAGHIAGIEVDRFGQRLDVMLKPMEGLLTGAPGVAGTTLLGDGRVLVVLDLASLLL